MKNAQTQAWADDLRTTTREQGINHLFIARGGGIAAACCMGIGCLTAGIYTERQAVDIAEGDNGMPPVAFHIWLGLREESHFADPTETFKDVYIDWDDLGLTCQGPTDADYDNDDVGCEVGEAYLTSCALLNDQWHLTFPQIGDLVAYFGVKDQP